MVNSGIATNLGGSIKFKSFGLTFADLQGTSGSGAKVFTLESYNQGSFLLFIRVKHSVAFAGGSISAMTISVDKGSTAAFFAAAFDIFQAVADGTLTEVPMPPIGQLSGFTIKVTVTPTGDSCSAATAGQVNIDICSVSVTTPTYAGLYT